MLHERFTVSYAFQPEKLADERKVSETIIAVFWAMEPFIRFMNQAVATH